MKVAETRLQEKEESSIIAKNGKRSGARRKCGSIVFTLSDG